MPDSKTYASAVAGIGTDLVEVSRIKNMLEKYGDSFLERTYTRAEIDYCRRRANPEIHFAARFAAKEAMAKALGTGFDGSVTLKSLSVENDANGAPIAVLDANAIVKLKEKGAEKMLVSLSHIKDYAQAFAVASK